MSVSSDFWAHINWTGCVCVTCVLLCDCEEVCWCMYCVLCAVYVSTNWLLYDDSNDFRRHYKYKHYILVTNHRPSTKKLKEQFCGYDSYVCLHVCVYMSRHPACIYVWCVTPVTPPACMLCVTVYLSHHSVADFSFTFLGN